MKIKINYVFVLFMAFSFCKTKTEVENVQVEFQIMQDKILKLPNILTQYKIDSNQFSQQEKRIKINNSTMIVFINVSCVTCIDDLDFWLENSEKLQEKNIPMIFILRASDDFYFFKFLVENENKELPMGSIYLDINDEFRTINEEFLTDETNTFFINQNLEIITFGNPVKNTPFAKELLEK